MYDELVKSLRLCTSDNRGYGCAKECAYGKKHPLNWWCMDYLLKDAADIIEGLVTNCDAAADIMKHQTEYIEELSKYADTMRRLKCEGWYLQQTKFHDGYQDVSTMPLPEPPKEET